MKKLRLLVLVAILIAVFTNERSLRAEACDLRCDSWNTDSLCDNGVDVGCDDWCKSSERCDYYGFYNLYGTCEPAPSHWCVCRGCI
jgi:hypothetical protein